ncbi:MAG: D-erythronate dehydrogenase [Actinomycetota bacterium]
MRITITGGAGFLGVALARSLLATRSDVEQLRLVDHVEPPDEAPDVVDDGRVEVLVGDLVEPEVVDRAVGPGTDVVYHLASVVSAGAEADFDLGFRVNLLGTLGLLERARELGGERDRPIRVVFASSLATYGAAAGGRTVDATAAQRPETSYGVQKACGELLINDYHRKGFVDGWTLRLPTVVVRPGAPNRAASGFASGIIREPLAGVDVVCPVDPATVMAVISPRRVIDAFGRLLDLPTDAVGADRTIPLPGLGMRVADAIAAVRAEGGDRPIGTVRFDPDPEIQRIVDSWPARIESAPAEALGMGGDDSVAAIVRQHIDDEMDR